MEDNSIGEDDQETEEIGLTKYVERGGYYSYPDKIGNKPDIINNSNMFYWTDLGSMWDKLTDRDGLKEFIQLHRGKTVEEAIEKCVNIYGEIKEEDFIKFGKEHKILPEKEI